MRKNQVYVCLTAVLSAAACGAPDFSSTGKAAGEAGACRERIAGGDTRIELFGHDTCLICGNSELEKIIDNDPQTSGQISITGSSMSQQEGIGFVVTAQTGVIFPGGTNAVVTGSYESLDVVGSIYIRALLDGTLVAEGIADAHIIGGTIGTGTPERSAYSIAVGAPYNQVELTLSNTGLGDVSADDQTIYPGIGTSTLNVFEVCST